MKLGPCPKKYMADGHRTVDPATTLRRIEPLCKIAGITRVADITDLDRLGIPVYSSIRPSAESGAISVYNGKGASKEQAKVSAIMEGLERYSGEVRGDRIKREMTERMLSSQQTIDPMDLILPRPSAFYLASQPVGWVKGFDLMEQEDIWVPASAVFHPYSSVKDLALFRTNTNGLASGNTMEEAVLHGLCEIIERDGWSQCEVRRCARSDLDPPEKGMAAELLSKFESKGVKIRLKDLTSDIGIPTFGASSDDVLSKDPSLLTLGIGTHMNPSIAVIRALTEVAQSRLTQIHGAREDTVKAKTSREIGYERMKKLNKLWFSDSGKRTTIEDFPAQDTMDIYEDIQIVLEKLRQRGFKRAVAVDLTRKELSIPVVRMIVPGLEVYAMDEERVGRRLVGGGQ